MIFIIEDVENIDTWKPLSPQYYEELRQKKFKTGDGYFEIELNFNQCKQKEIHFDFYNLYLFLKEKEFLESKEYFSISLQKFKKDATLFLELSKQTPTKIEQMSGLDIFKKSTDDTYNFVIDMDLNSFSEIFRWNLNINVFVKVFLGFTKKEYSYKSSRISWKFEKLVFYNPKYSFENFKNFFLENANEIYFSNESGEANIYVENCEQVGELFKKHQRVDIYGNKKENCDKLTILGKNKNIKKAEFDVVGLEAIKNISINEIIFKSTNFYKIDLEPLEKQNIKNAYSFIDLSVDYLKIYNAQNFEKLNFQNTNIGDLRFYLNDKIPMKINLSYFNLSNLKIEELFIDYRYFSFFDEINLKISSINIEKLFLLIDSEKFGIEQEDLSKVFFNSNSELFIINIFKKISKTVNLKQLSLFKLNIFEDGFEYEDFGNLPKINEILNNLKVFKMNDYNALKFLMNFFNIREFFNVSK